VRGQVEAIAHHLEDSGRRQYYPSTGRLYDPNFEAARVPQRLSRGNGTAHLLHKIMIDRSALCRICLRMVD